MPYDKAEFERRMAAVGEKDRIRGAFFNVVFKLVEEQLGPATAQSLRVGALADKLRDLVSYPAKDFLRLIVTAADLLEPRLGSVEKALQAMGRGAVEHFASSGAGSIMFNLLARRDPSALLKQIGISYATTVSYGKRHFEPSGSASGKLIYEGDPMPPAYHEGVLLGGLAALGYEAKVSTRLTPIGRFETVLSWTPKAP